MDNVQLLHNRATIKIVGSDRLSFLQGLLTNDVFAINDHLQYSLMLTPQGKFLYDFFIFQIGDAILLDVDKQLQNEILKKFQLYKLRSNVQFASADFNVYFSLHKLPSTLSFLDPRHPLLGFRSYSTEMLNTPNCPDLYLKQRINLMIPDDSDLGIAKSFPLEFGLDKLNAISFSKGCYVGQELTARTHHRGVIRKAIYHISSTEGLPPHHTELEQPKGIILSHNGIEGLALFRQEDVQDIKSFAFDGKIIKLS